jgi:hypothetical protein
MSNRNEKELVTDILNFKVSYRPEVKVSVKIQISE